MNNLNPCELLSQDQLRRFAVDNPPRPSRDSTFQTATCSFSSDSASTALRVTPVTTAGIERFEPGKVTGDVKARTVQGFPAREIHTPGASVGNDFCSVAVDVADGQVLHAMFNEHSTKPPLTTEVVCQKANELADAVMTTLLAR